METIILIIVLILLPLAVKEISFILMHGSIFESLRVKTVKWKSLEKLFSCHLCMTAQVSIWFVTMPLFFILFLHNHHFLMNNFNLNADCLVEEIFVNVFACFMFTMGIACLAKFFWDATEYLPQKLKATKDFLDKKIQIDSIMTMNSNVSTVKNKTQVLTFKDFTLSDFYNIIKYLYGKCNHFDCAVERRDCRKQEVFTFLTNWYKDKNGADPHFFSLLQDKVESALKRYYSHSFGIAGDKVKYFYRDITDE